MTLDRAKLLPHQDIDIAVPFDISSVGELFLRRADETPKKDFLFSPGRREISFTFEEFREKALAVSDYYRSTGLGKGDRINVILANSAEFILLYFAAFFSGVTIVPINQDLSPREMLYIIKDSRSKTVLCSKPYLHKLDAVSSELPENLQIIPVGELPDFEPVTEGEKAAGGSEIADVSLTDEAVIIYTSGTTGNPKGVILNHLNLLSDAYAVSRWFQFSPETRTLCILPMFHNNGQVITLLTPLYAGGSTVIVEGKVSLLSFWDLVEKYGVTWTSVTPSIFSILLSLPVERRDNTLSGIICGGQILTESLQKSFEERYNVPIYEGFGLTETTSFSCFNNFPADMRKKGSVGRPLPVNEMAIIDEKGNELNPGMEGEICIRGFNVTNGYLGLPEKNETAFANGWFHSGDYGYRDEDGYYYFKGREDALIIKGGENIYPAELENVLFQHPSVLECAVIGVPDKLLGEEIAAFVLLKEDAQETEDDLREYCKNKIAHFKRAKRIIIINRLDDLDRIPKGPTKKVLYRKLREYYAAKNF